MKTLKYIPIAAIVTVLLIGSSVAIQDENGSISGVVHPAEAMATIEARLNGDVVGTTNADPETGDFTIEGLEPGTYEVVISSEVEGYEEQSLDDIVVEAGEDHDLGEIHLEAEDDEGWPLD